MGQNPEGRGGQPFQNRTEGARSKLDAIRRSSRDALNKLFPQAPKLVTETVGSSIGNIKVSKDIRQRHIQSIQTDEISGVKTQTQTKPVEPGLTEQEQTALDEARRRALQEEAERAGGPTQTDIADANAGKLGSKFANFVKKHPVAVGVGTTLGLGTIAAGINYELNNRTEAHASISTPEGPSTFDNKADKITVGPNNTVAVDQATLDTLPSFDANGKPILLFDLKLPAGKEVTATKELHTTLFDSQSITSQAEIAEVRNSLVTPEVPIGSQEFAPIDGRAFVIAYDSINGGLSLDGKTNLTPPVGVKIEFMGPDNTLYFYNILLGGVASSEADGILNILINAPIISRENSNGREWEKGLPVESGTPLFTNNRVVTIGRSLGAGTNGSLGPDGKRVPANLQYHIDSSNKRITPK